MVNGITERKGQGLHFFVGIAGNLCNVSQTAVRGDGVPGPSLHFSERSSRSKAARCDFSKLKVVVYSDFHSL